MACPGVRLRRSSEGGTGGDGGGQGWMGSPAEGLRLDWRHVKATTFAKPTSIEGHTYVVAQVAHCQWLVIRRFGHC